MTACLAADERNRQSYRRRSSLSRGIYTSRIKCETATQMSVRFAHRNVTLRDMHVVLVGSVLCLLQCSGTRGVNLMYVKKIALKKNT